jgi:hypothetical protein
MQRTAESDNGISSPPPSLPPVSYQMGEIMPSQDGPSIDQLRARRYHIDRARVRKLVNRDSVLVTAKMTDYALRAVLDEMLKRAVAHTSDGRDIGALSDARKALECWQELQLRGEQLELG